MRVSSFIVYLNFILLNLKELPKMVCYHRKVNFIFTSTFCTRFLNKFIKFGISFQIGKNHDHRALFVAVIPNAHTQMYNPNMIICS